MVAYGAGWLLASMRPPLNAGENGGDPVAVKVEWLASMRPPLNAGENCQAAQI